MPNQNNTRTRTNTNNSARTNNSTRRRRRGAITPHNVKRIKGVFQKPPKHPGRPTYSPPPPLPHRRHQVLYANNLNIGNMTANQMNALLREIS